MSKGNSRVAETRQATCSLMINCKSIYNDFGYCQGKLMQYASKRPKENF